jgi:hypothetical protein
VTWRGAKATTWRCTHLEGQPTRGSTDIPHRGASPHPTTATAARSAVQPPDRRAGSGSWARDGGGGSGQGGDSGATLPTAPQRRQMALRRASGGRHAKRREFDDASTAHVAAAHAVFLPIHPFQLSLLSRAYRHESASGGHPQDAPQPFFDERGWYATMSTQRMPRPVLPLTACTHPYASLLRRHARSSRS